MEILTDKPEVLGPSQELVKTKSYKGYTDANEAPNFTYPPEAKEGDQAKPYALGLDPSCPVNPLTVFHITFQKAPHEPTYRDQVTPPEAVYPVQYMTEEQRKAVLLKAETDAEIEWLVKVLVEDPATGRRRSKIVKKRAKKSEFIKITPLPERDGIYPTTVKIKEVYEVEGVKTAELIRQAAEQRAYIESLEKKLDKKKLQDAQAEANWNKK